MNAKQKKKAWALRQQRGKKVVKEYRDVILKNRPNCPKCGILMTPPGGLAYLRDREATIDHIYPQSLGGYKWGLDNIEIICYRCNQIKADKVYH